MASLVLQRLGADLDHKAATVTWRTSAVSQSDTKLKFECVRTRTGFEALEAEWTALFERAGRGEQVFQQFNWLWHWVNHYTDAATEFAIVVGRQAGRVVVIWPLVVERPLGLRALAWMGDPVSQYGDVLLDAVADRSAVMEQSWRFVLAATRPDLVRLAKVRADAVVKSQLEATSFAVVTREDAPFIALEHCGGFEGVAQQMSAKHRKNRRRQLRRLEERGQLSLDVHADVPAAADATRLAMTLKRAWLNTRGLVSRAFADVRIDAFFADAARGTVRPCGVSVSVLASRGEAADVNISITCKGRRVVHVLAYALKFERFGVGNHHLDMNLQRALADGISTYDFMAPAHDYKMELASGVVAVEDHARAVSRIGRIYTEIHLARLRPAAKRLMLAMPRGLVRRLVGRHTSTPV